MHRWTSICLLNRPCALDFPTGGPCLLSVSQVAANLLLCPAAYDFLRKPSSASDITLTCIDGVGSVFRHT